jgi:soluble cytochrome b562
MSDQETPSVEEIKERLKVEIPVEEDAVKAETATDVASELKNLGRQFAEAVQSAWNSTERVRVENEIREGVKSFVDEVDKVIREAKESGAAEKVKEEAAQVKERVETAELGRKARNGVIEGLRWFSEELGKLADQFTPVEKAPADDNAPEETE